MLYCFICPLDILLGSEEALTVYISVHCSLASTCTATLCYYAFASVKSAGCQKFVEILFGDGEQHHKIAKLISPPIVPATYMVYCKGWELKFGNRKFTVDIATVPFGFVDTCT